MACACGGGWCHRQRTHMLFHTAVAKSERLNRSVYTGGMRPLFQDEYRGEEMAYNWVIFF